MEACKIVILVNENGGTDVGAPMKYKALCYDILDDAHIVVEHTDAQHFRGKWIGPGAKLTIVMGMDGRVDVGAPLPNREYCYKLIDEARQVIERFDDASAPPLRPFSAALMEG